MIVDPVSGEVLAEHDLAQRGTASVLDEHYDGARPAPNRGPRPRTTVEQQFCGLGASAERFLVGAAAIGNTRLSSELEVLRALGAAHGHEALVGALTRAVAFRRFKAAADVRSILAAGAGTPQPRPAGDAQILDLPTAPTRSLDAYAVGRPSGDQQVPS